MGAGSRASTSHTSRIRVSFGDRLSSLAWLSARATCLDRRHLECAARNIRIRAMDTRSAAAAMSMATTASRQPSTRRISSKRARGTVVHAIPCRTRMSRVSSGSRDTHATWSPRILRPAPIASGTGCVVMPSTSTPSKKLAPASRSEAHPVTAAASGSRADCSMIRCSGRLPSTCAGT
jgi:hypothetical protein